MLLVVAVAGSAIKWLRDTMGLIESASEVNALAAKEKDNGGVYFVTAFSGLLAPYWDSGAAGLLIGISQYTNPSHIARATLEANAFQTRAIIESMKLDSGSDLKHLKVDGGMTNGDLCMQILADTGGFTVIRPEMREYVVYFMGIVTAMTDGLDLDLPPLELPFALEQLSNCSDGICPNLKHLLRLTLKETLNLLQY